MPRNFIFLLALLLSSIFSNIQAAEYDPRLTWRVLETEHFEIHYHDGLKSESIKAAYIAEAQYQEITEYFEWEPEDKTIMILTDRVDVSNGAASPFPINTMVIHVSPPFDVSGLEDYNDWLETVIRHEFVHIVHLDKGMLFANFMRKIFGRYPTPIFYAFTLFPNSYATPWFVEGLATHLETNHFKQVGRGQSSYYRAMMRLEVNKGIRSLSQLNVYPTSWPNGTSWYLYGVYFLKFLEDKYGEEKIKEFIDEYSAFPVPYFMSYVATQTFGKRLGELWTEFDRYLEHEFRAEIDTINNSQLSPVEKITDSGFYTAYPVIDGDHTLYYLQNNLKEPPSIISFSNENKHEIAKMYFSKRFDAHSKSGLLVAATETYASTNRYYDLYVINPKNGSRTRITTQGRYVLAAWDNVGEQIIAVRNYAGNHSLHLLDRFGNELKKFGRTAEDIQIGSVDFSRDGRTIVASVFRHDFGWNIELFDLDTEEWSRITNTPAIETQIRYTPDGESIIFSADYDGVYNIYKMNLMTKRMQKMTNVLGGAFYPDLDSANNMLYFAGLSENGYDIYRLSLDNLPLSDSKLTIETHKPQLQLLSGNRAKYKLDPDWQQKEYSPFRHMFPNWWFPVINLNSSFSYYGFTFGGSDALQFHRYQGFYGYNNQYGIPLWNLSYDYSRLFSHLNLETLRSYDIAFVEAVDGDVVPGIITARDAFSIKSNIPWKKSKRLLDNELGAAIFDKHPVYVHEQLKTPADETLAIAYYGLKLNTQIQRSRAATFSDGIKASFYVEWKPDYADEKQASDGMFEHLHIRNIAQYGEFAYASPVIGENIYSFSLAAGHRDESVPFHFVNVSSDPLASGAANQDSISPLSPGIFLPGFNYLTDVHEGSYFTRAALKMHSRLWTVDRGLLLPPIGLKRFKSALYGYHGSLGDALGDGFVFNSLGAELHTEISWSYRLDLDIVLGVARGLGKNGESFGYASLTSLF